MGSILKRERTNDRIGLAWLRGVLAPNALSAVKNLVVGDAMEYRHLTVVRSTFGWTITPNLTPEMSRALVQWLPVLDTEDAEAWVDMQRDVVVGDKRNMESDLLRALHADVLWVRHVYLMQRYPGLASTFVNYLQTSTQWSRMDVNNSRAYGRANFLEVSKMALYYNKESAAVQRPLQVRKVKALVDSMPWLKSLEVQEGFDSAKLSFLLTQLKDTLARLNVPTDKQFDLRFRKIRRTKKTGMYLPALQLLIVDPRETQSLWHELAHWLEDTGAVQMEWDGSVSEDIRERYPKGRWEKEMRAYTIENGILCFHAIIGNIKNSAVVESKNLP